MVDYSEGVPLLRIMAMLEQSEVNGPGRRLVIWTQGCGKACVGCFNPESWTTKGGTLWSPLSLAAWVRQRAVNFEGITLTGGDPLEQSEALSQFLACLHAEDEALSCLPGGIILFTGYTTEEIAVLPGEAGSAARKCLEWIDLVIDGRFAEGLKIQDRLAGSANQRFHFSNHPGRGRVRIGLGNVETDQGVEIHPTDVEDELEITGFPAVSRKWLLGKGIRIL